MRHITRRLLPLLLLTAALVGIGTGQALAHYAYNDGVAATYNGGSACVDVRSETSHGSQNYGYIKTGVESWQSYAGYHCAAYDSRPAGYHKVKGQLLKWNASAGAYDICWTDSTRYSGTSGHAFAFGIHFTGRPYCGNGTYGNYGRGYFNNNGTWVGGIQWSDSHYLPA